MERIAFCVAVDAYSSDFEYQWKMYFYMRLLDSRKKVKEVWFTVLSRVIVVLVRSIAIAIVDYGDKIKPFIYIYIYIKNKLYLHKLHKENTWQWGNWSANTHTNTKLQKLIET